MNFKQDCRCYDPHSLLFSGQNKVLTVDELKVKLQVSDADTRSWESYSKLIIITVGVSVSDLGHGGTGEISQRHTRILQRRSGWEIMTLSCTVRCCIHIVFNDHCIVDLSALLLLYDITSKSSFDNTRVRTLSFQAWFVLILCTNK